jgi:hypothetical protein
MQKITLYSNKNTRLAEHAACISELVLNCFSFDAQKWKKLNEQNAERCFAHSLYSKSGAI